LDADNVNGWIGLSRV